MLDLVAGFLVEVEATLKYPPAADGVRVYLWCILRVFRPLADHLQFNPFAVMQLVDFHKI